MSILDSIQVPHAAPRTNKDGQINNLTKAEINLSQTMNLKEEMRKKLGSWYIHRHGVRADGNIEEMITLIQVRRYYYYYNK